MGNPERAYRRLNEALERERTPTLYPRLWLWMLAPAEHKPETLAPLKRFLANPPSDLSPWDLQLGQFMTSATTLEEFFAAVKLEVQRRKSEALPMDDLMCEVWFYTGQRLEIDGATTEAIHAYRKALTSRPDAFKWEWAYARLHFARLMRAADPNSQLREDPGPPHATVFPYALGTGEDLGILIEARKPGDLLLYLDFEHRGELGPQMMVIGLNPKKANALAPDHSPPGK